MSKCHLFAPPGVGLKLCDFLMWLRILTIVPSSLHQHRWLCFNHKSMLSYTVDVNVFGICVNHSLTGRTLSYTEFWFWRHNLEEIGISSTESWQSFNMAWQAPWRKFNHGLSNSWKSMGVGHNAYEKKTNIYIYIYISLYQDTCQFSGSTSLNFSPFDNVFSEWKVIFLQQSSLTISWYPSSLAPFLWFL